MYFYGWIEFIWVILTEGFLFKKLCVIQGFVKGEELFSSCDLTSSFSFIYRQRTNEQKKDIQRKSHKMTGKIPLLLQIHGVIYLIRNIIKN